MQSALDKLQFETGAYGFGGVEKLRPMPVFCDEAIAFLDAISKAIFARDDIRAYPDLASFGFLCRARNLKRLKKEYGSFTDYRCGKGVSLHFTPSNIPLNFAYSLFLGLVTGNVCLIRMSSKEFPQATILVDIIRNVMESDAFSIFRDRVAIFRYQHDKDVTDYLSSLCDIRIIWGSDDTISEIRTSPLPARSFDVTFADRYSMCVINAEAYLNDADPHKEATAFYNDTLFFDQNACTSPRLMYWLGDAQTVVQAQETFWAHFESAIRDRDYRTSGNLAVEKLLNQQIAAIELDGIGTGLSGDSLVRRTNIERIPEDLEPFACPGGFFLEYANPSLAPLAESITRKLQTLTYIGFDAAALFDELGLDRAIGIDRLVANGRASEFGLVWDGYDMLFQMSKKVAVL